MRIGIPKESLVNEARVAMTPKTVQQLLSLGFSVSVEYGAGQMARFNDEAYIQSGAIVTNVDDVWKADIIIKVNAPEENEISLLKSGMILISFIWPLKNPILTEKLAKRGITVIAMDTVPRISRTQSFDALSSMANIAGYRAIIEAAYEFGRFFVGQTTAAGNIPPAKIMVVGAGVAGLSAISTANSLGAIVRAFDSRQEVKEQIKSIGAEFLEIDFKQSTKTDNSSCLHMTSETFIEAEKKLLYKQAKEVDIIVTTAMIPNQVVAPKLITLEMVNSMKPGSVIVDLSASSGGNCEYTIPDKIVTTDNGVKIIGYTNLVSRLPTQASQLYSTNIVNLLKLLCKNKDGTITIDLNDVIIRCITIIHNGNIIWPAPLSIQYFDNKQPHNIQHTHVSELRETRKLLPSYIKNIILVLSFVLFGYLSAVAPKDFLSHLTIFILSCFVGYYVVWNVTYSLHTPLMSVTNAISGIIIVGALLQINYGGWISILSLIAILASSINIFGGFAITYRMLKMFRKK